MVSAIGARPCPVHWGWAPGCDGRHGAGAPPHAARQPKDPKSFQTIEDLRQELQGQQQGGGGFVTGAINWLSAAASGAGSGSLQTALRGLFQGGLGRGESEEGPSLEHLAAGVDPNALRALQALLLGSRQSTLKLIRRYPAVLEMDRGDLMQRLVWLKGEFPGSDVSRMVELAPVAILAGDWGQTRAQLAAAGAVLRAGLAGADVNFLFSEDPSILFEELEVLRLGLERMRELWPELSEAALANSEPLQLALAIRACAQRPPSGF